MPWVAFLYVPVKISLTTGLLWDICFISKSRASTPLNFSHVINFIYGVPATEIEITFTQMVLVMNLTTFAWNIHDGRQKEEVG